jgi:hypothetical protein
VGSTDELGERLRLFLRDNVSSYEALETLFLLARNAGRAWSAAEVAAELNVTLESIGEALAQLVGVGGLVEVTRPSTSLLYRYAPSDDSRAQQVTQLLRAYDERRLSVVRMMSANALERVRSAAIALAGLDKNRRGKD